MSRERHGHATGGISKTYRAWASMHARCRGKGVSAQVRKDYAARGIKVCKRWSSFANFLADMGEVPKGQTLDRVKNHLGYSKGNCRWATRLEQNQNTRRNVHVTWKGETLCLAEWERRTGMRQSFIQYRLAKGWSPERVFTTVPIQGNNGREPMRLEFRSGSHTVSEWAALLGIKRSTIKNRLHRGWTVERALSTLEDARFK